MGQNHVAPHVWNRGRYGLQCHNHAARRCGALVLVTSIEESGEAGEARRLPTMVASRRDRRPAIGRFTSERKTPTTEPIVLAEYSVGPGVETWG